MERRDFLVTGASAGMLAASGCTTGSGSVPDVPLILGPIVGGKHGRPFTAHADDLSALGYIEEEYFIEGVATRFEPVGELGLDGRWTVKPAGTAPYRTRVLVRRPSDPTRFNGTLVLEWINVTAGVETATIGASSLGIYDSGFALATVSCQQMGIYGFEKHPEGLRAWDPERYGSLVLAGDSYSYDIFSQAGRALGREKRRTGADPLGGLDVSHVIATGASQSAIRLRTYINSIQPRERIFDGFVPALDFGTAMGFDDWVYDTSVLAPGDTGKLFSLPAQIRDDQSTPVIVVNSEFETLRYLQSRQPDNDYFRFWEIAGASHVAARNGRYLERIGERDGFETNKAFTSGSEVTWEPTADAALDQMREWVSGGQSAPRQARIELTNDERPKVSRDEHGNALGGVRLPEVDVPIAQYNGVGAGVALLAGTTEPFSREKLVNLYGSKDVYVRQVERATSAALEAGVITRRRAAEYSGLADSVQF